MERAELYLPARFNQIPHAVCAVHSQPVRAFERASGHAVPYEIVARRAGDIAACYADPTLARERLGWSARRDLDAMCRDAWRWQCNPAAC